MKGLGSKTQREIELVPPHTEAEGRRAHTVKIQVLRGLTLSAASPTAAAPRAGLTSRQAVTQALDTIDS